MHAEDATAAAIPTLTSMRVSAHSCTEFPSWHVGGCSCQACGLPRTRIERIASEQTGITADTALRLAKALGTSAQLWLNLQNDYDVEVARRELGKALDRIETVNKPKAA